MNKSKAVILIVIVSVLVGTFYFMSQNSSKVESENGRQIVHKLGTTNISSIPKKVVSFDYGILDTLDTLGVDVLGLPKSTVPDYLKKYKDEKYLDFGTLKEPNLELLNENKPDLIIISGRMEGSYDALSKIAPTIYYAIDPQDYIGSFTKNTMEIAAIFDKEDIAKKELKTIDNLIEKTKNSVSQENALIVMSNSKELSAYGKNSRFGIIHNTLGFGAVDEVADSTHGSSISFEYIVEKNPDYIFVIDRAAVVGGEVSAKDAFENVLVQSTDAYKEKNIVYLDPFVWYVSSGGIKSTTKMITEVSDSLK